MTKRKRGKQMTMQKLDLLYYAAKSGDARAEEKFRKEAARLAKRVNSQILEMERADRQSADCLKTSYYLSEERGRTRFRERTKTGDLDELAEDVEQMMIFKQSKGYSLKEALKEEEQVEKISGALQAAGVTLEDDEDRKVAFWMNELFRSDAWAEMKKAHGRSTGLIQTAQDAFTRGRTVDDLTAAYNEYKSGRDDLDLPTVWAEFTGVSKW